MPLVQNGVLQAQGRPEGILPAGMPASLPGIPEAGWKAAPGARTSLSPGTSDPCLLFDVRPAIPARSSQRPDLFPGLPPRVQSPAGNPETNPGTPGGGDALHLHRVREILPGDPPIPGLFSGMPAFAPARADPETPGRRAAPVRRVRHPRPLGFRVAQRKELLPVFSGMSKRALPAQVPDPVPEATRNPCSRAPV